VAQAAIPKESVVLRNREGTGRRGFAGRRMGCGGGDIEWLIGTPTSLP
jgi:hypothetical protein